MIKNILFLVVVLFLTYTTSAQNYNPVVNYNINGTPINGLKIKTNLPFTNSSQMPTIIIEGYAYGQASTIGVILNYYIFNGEFINYSISSFGGYLPNISLAQENGKVIIYINEKTYFSRFSIRAFAQGMSGDIANNYVNWNIVDEPLIGSNIVNLNYKNSFRQVDFSNGIITKEGKIGIGTKNPDELLSVKGKIHANEVKVDLAVPADYVFQKYYTGNSSLNASYQFKSLEEIKSFTEQHHHLPDLPSANEIQQTGLSLGEMNNLLLQKIEELTLHLIEQNEEIKKLKQSIKNNK
ncbi:hypothetical protein [Empedobacter sp. UBA7248]|uniref:hypothetical protein n=1 Tax=Empedobacter sp. UBA7248 TaxID=1946448 RepID=UPI0025C4DD84|nr:hypothetical protein [Empedobacter sp. UBA7248]